MQVHAEKGFKPCSVFFPSAATPANKMSALLERLIPPKKIGLRFHDDAIVKACTGAGWDDVGIERWGRDDLLGSGIGKSLRQIGRCLDGVSFFGHAGPLESMAAVAFGSKVDDSKA